MRDQIRASLPRRSSPSWTRDRGENESSRIKQRNVSSRSPLQRDDVSREFVVCRTDRELDVDGFRRQCGHSAPYEVDMQMREGFFIKDQREEDEERDNERYRKHSHLGKDTYSGKDYPNRSYSSETINHGLGGLMRSTMMQCLSDEPETSRFITSNDYKYSPYQERRNVLRNNETDRLESNSRDYNDSSRLRLNGEDARDKDTSSPLSQVGSSGADLQDESSRLVSLSSRCCVRVKDSERVDERRVDYSENRCASHVLQTIRFDGYVGGNSVQQGKSFRDLGYSRDFNCGDHDSPGVSSCGISREIVGRRNFQSGSGKAVKELASVRHDVYNMAKDTDLLMQGRGYGSNMVDVDAADTHLDFFTKERMTLQYDSMEEHYPYVELGSSVVNERDDKAHHHRKVGYEERKIVSLNSKRQLLIKDYQYDGVDGRIPVDFSRPDVVVRDDKAPQSITVCLNNERETCLDSESKAVYSENRRQELINDYHIRNDGRMHFDVHVGEDFVVDRGGRVVQLQRVSLNKERTAYLDNERDEVYLHHKSQQLKKDYDSGTDARIHPGVNWEDARGRRRRGVSLNDRKEEYLQSESQQFLKDHETNSYAMMHPDVYKSDILVDREDARCLKYRRVLLNDRKEAYLQCESQQLLKDHEADPYALMHPDVNKSNILVDARALKLRQASFDDGKEPYLDNERGYAYLGYEYKQLKNDYEYGIDGTMHPYVNKSDVLVEREDSTAPELRGVSYHVGNESYVVNAKGDAYLRYESQQLKKDYDHGINDRMYRDVNRSDIIVHHEDAKALERRGVSFENDNEAYLDNERVDAYMHYKIQESKKDYDSGFDAMIYPDVNRSEIVIDKEAARALERRGVSLNDGRKVYMHYKNNQLLKDDEIDAYEMMHHDVRISLAGKQEEEALRCRRYPFDGHANRRYPDGRHKVYHSCEYGLRDEVIHENVADDYNDVKPYSGRFSDYEERDKRGSYAVEGGTSTEQFGYVADERNFGNDPRPRIPAKERLGGRVEDSRVDLKYRVVHQVKNPKRKGKSHNRNQKNIA